MKNQKLKTLWNEVGSLGEGRIVPTTSKGCNRWVDEPYSGFAHTIELPSTITLVS